MKNWISQISGKITSKKLTKILDKIIEKAYTEKEGREKLIQSINELAFKEPEAIFNEVYDKEGKKLTTIEEVEQKSTEELIIILEVMVEELKNLKLQ